MACTCLLLTPSSAWTTQLHGNHFDKQRPPVASMLPGPVEDFNLSLTCHWYWPHWWPVLLKLSSLVSRTTLCPDYPCFLFPSVSLLGPSPHWPSVVGTLHGSVLELLLFLPDVTFPGDSLIFMPLWSPLLLAGGSQISISSPGLHPEHHLHISICQSSLPLPKSSTVTLDPTHPKYSLWQHPSPTAPS